MGDDMLLYEPREVKESKELLEELSELYEPNMAALCTRDASRSYTCELVDDVECLADLGSWWRLVVIAHVLELQMEPMYDVFADAVP